MANTDSRRKNGLTITELLISMTIMTIVVALVAMMSTMAFKNAAKLQESMELDAEIVKLQTSLRQIITRNWTASQTLGSSDDSGATINVENQSLVFYTAVPVNGEESFWETVVSTLSYQNSQLLFQFPDLNNNVVTDNVVEYLEDFKFSLENSWIIYKAKFKTKHLTREATGAVRFY